jgi:NADP-dependent 3-hydroxy acid dehydrogenase YdfG
MNSIALITGASSGIGRATAKLLAANNYDVIITGRRSELLEELEENIIKTTSAEVYSLAFDIRDKNAVENSINSLPIEWQNISILINNAGLSAGFEPINEGALDDWDRMIDTNIKGLLTISPGMVETEFSIVRFHGDENKAEEVYKGFTPLYAEDIAETILFMISRPAHVNIDDILIMPTAQGLTRNVIREDI